MRLSHKSILQLFTLLLVFITVPQMTKAQDDVESLGRILNEPNLNENGQALTGEDYANMFFEKCMSEDQDVFVESEREILCSCTAAKMSENLTIEDFQALYKKSNPGREARGKTVAFAHLPCMQYVLDTKINRECRKLPLVKRLISGKNTLCSCTRRKYKKHLRQNASFIARNARINNPMSMNPLALYFESKEHEYHIENITEGCKFDIDYNKYN